jgi:hypothetical protein
VRSPSGAGYNPCVVEPASSNWIRAALIAPGDLRCRAGPKSPAPPRTELPQKEPWESSIVSSQTLPLSLWDSPPQFGFLPQPAISPSYPVFRPNLRLEVRSDLLPPTRKRHWVCKLRVKHPRAGHESLVFARVISSPVGGSIVNFKVVIYSCPLRCVDRCLSTRR